MMCPKCGRTIPDGTQCPCGAPVLSSNPAVNLIKTLGSSPKFLAAAILTSVMVLFSILASMGSKDLLVSLYYYGANYGVDPDVFYPAMSALENSLGVGTVVAALLVGRFVNLFNARLPLISRIARLAQTPPAG